MPRPAAMVYRSRQNLRWRENEIEKRYSEKSEKRKLSPLRSLIFSFFFSLF
jgi:hypothetical protein